MNKHLYYKEIYNRFGTVTRARNCFLYTKSGNRLTDLYQENGRAILGWDAGNAFTFLKNILNRGQVGSFITEDTNRLAKAVSELLDSSKNTTRKVFCFSNKKDAVKAGLMFSPQSTSVYIPWSINNIQWQQIDSVVIAPTLPWTETVYILAVKEECIANNPESEILISNTVKFPFALEAGITRGIYNLISTLPKRQEKDWFIYDTVVTKYWERKGPYLFPKIKEEDYNNFVLHCMDCGILINPDYNNPSIVPFGADKGVFTKLKNNPFMPTI